MNDPDNGWINIGHISEPVVFRPEFKDSELNDWGPLDFTVPVPHEVVVDIVLDEVDPDLMRLLCDIPDGFPLWYVRPQLALPWGDSAYTHRHHPYWFFGPRSPYTQSGEGPRRMRDITERFLRARTDGVVAAITDALSKFRFEPPEVYLGGPDQ